ncbi:chloride channel protein [Cesiribacter andamanensis]|uniref:H(+)/Cl(-) exchange transporter ClcA n=1 Tax=Cesiribacter andamanensis AMV16 TaxID=1279009 RepID=M7N752_9BACT|nr:chloride channel protein [Cesiribacter andamanensis]EMR03066.1 H(+)/Cl(-) exchange transporter ClcA [Cesiribacter andamanensis AMV16]
MTRPNKIQLAFLRWRKKQSNNRIMPFVLSVVVGLIVGLSAILIKTIIHYFEIYAVYFAPSLLYFLLPLIGFLLVTFLNRTAFTSTAYFSGTKHVVEAIEQHSSVIRFRLIYSKFITTGLTIGFGGSSGVEAAIITSGSAVGSNVGRFLGLGYRLRTLLIGCGVAAGISAVYNAPMGGFIFALETILPEFTPTLLIPLLVSAATGKILFEFIMGEQLRFGVPLADFSYEQIPLIIGLGVLGMFMSVYLLKTYRYCSELFARIRSPYVRALVGGLVLGSIIYLLPPMYGEGYVSINALLNGEEASLFQNSPLALLPRSAWFSLLFFFLVALAKPVSTGICVNSGGEGGYFAPSLITGGLLGYFYFKVVMLLFPFLDLNPATYIFLGMASVFACIMNAPVTAIFLVAEITQSYQLFVPLMLVCAVSYFLKYYKENLSQGVTQPSYRASAKRVDRILLNQLTVRQLTESDGLPVQEEATFRQILEAFSRTNRDILQVQNAQGQLVGVITLNDIRARLSDTTRYDSLLARDLMHAPDVVVDINEPASEVLAKFDKLERWYLPVMRDDKIIGFISKSDLLSQYRTELTRVNRFFR